MFTPGPPVSVGGVQCRVTWLPLIESHNVDGTFVSVGDPGTAVNYTMYIENCCKSVNTAWVKNYTGVTYTVKAGILILHLY